MTTVRFPRVETIFNPALKIQATIVQVFERNSKTCQVLPKHNVAVKIVLCTILHDINF